ncbi:MAG: hypothetical protein ACKPKO_45255, partial [Candidatus Fonsibacter sp.]
NALHLMLYGKLGTVSLMTHQGVKVDNTQFGYPPTDVWDVEDAAGPHRRNWECLYDYSDSADNVRSSTLQLL